LRAAGDVAELTEVQDVLPTLIELCGVEQPTAVEFDGISLAPLLREEKSQLPDRMMVVQFSRMQAPVPKKGDAAVLWRRWRLVGGDSLYDLAADPAQAQNVIARHPDVAEKMRAHYEQWWSGVAPRLNEFGAVTLGADAENPSQLSPADWQDVFLDQGAQVRRGLRVNGPWNVVVDRDGEYEFELRRWAREADAPLAAELPPTTFVDGVSAPGVALPIAKARVKIAGFDESRLTAAEDKAATFVATLKAGRTQLQTWFYDEDGNELCGAYYVYVRRR
jgi:arylsulfatase